MPKVNFQIVIDTKEQNPLSFPSREIETVREGLGEGDYAIKIEGNLQPVRIERKSVGDLFGSFSGKRYEAEKDKIRRAKDAGCRYIIAIESSCSEVRKGHRYYQDGQWHQVQKDGLTMCRQLFTISQRYGIELAFCNGRDDMSFYVQELLLTYVRNFDK